MASDPPKVGMKRQRCGYSGCDHQRNIDGDDDNTLMTLVRSKGSRIYYCPRSSDHASFFFIWILRVLQRAPSIYSGYSRHEGVRRRKQSFSFHKFLGSSLLLLFLSRCVLGETHLRHHLIETARGSGNRSWEGKGYQGKHELLQYGRGKDLSSVENRMQQHGLDVIERKQRILQSGQRLENIIRQQNSKVETLSPELRNDFDAEESFSGSQAPNEIDVASPLTVTTPPVDEPDIEPFDYGEFFKKGNPLIRNKLPIDFDMQLLVENTITNELLRVLEVFLENYIQNEYKKLIDGNRNGDDDGETGSITNSNLETLKLGEVDLTLQLLESRWWQDRKRRQLDSNSATLSRGSLRSKQRDMQEEIQSSDTKIITISVNGSVNYSMEVDGSIPTPDEVEKEWIEAYHDIIAQNQLQRAFDNAQIAGVLRVEDVSAEQDLSAKNDGDTRNFNEDYDDNESTTNDPANLYQNNTENNNADQSVEVTKNDSKQSSRKDELERPSTLSIVFGFILTGIAVLGLFGYAYIFYRKRQKRLKKKKKMKESITFSSANLAAAAAASAAAPTAGRKNSKYASKARPQSASRPVPTPHPSQMPFHSMMLSQSESEETSYRGLESSVGSEDITDSFANELKLAASRDKQAWDEFQRRKESHEKIEINRYHSTNRKADQNRHSSISASVPSLLTKNTKRNVEDREHPVGFETPLGRDPSFTKSFPYGDEAHGFSAAGDDEFSELPSSVPWEPYNSSLSLGEEKKDETSANAFFVKKLKDIEKDLAVSGGQATVIPKNRSSETKNADDNSDILSEVSELSKYVRRYERRKDRKNKREEFLHERLSAAERAPRQNSMAANSMSIGMDGRVYNPKKSDKNSIPNRSPTRGPQLAPAPLSSYAESFIGSQKNELSESLSIVSEDEDDPEGGSPTNSRLGISPYRISYDEVYYRKGSVQNEANSLSERTATTPSRSRAEQDYRYSVGYGHDKSKSPSSSSSRLANLRANDAIIDNSSSIVNLNMDAAVPTGTSSDSNKNDWAGANKGGGVARLNLQRSNKDKNTAAVVAAATPQQKTKKAGNPKAKRFDKLRGMFEQKTTEQPNPIFPSGENWQYTGGNRSKKNF